MIIISEVIFIENTCSISKKFLRVESRESKIPGKVAGTDRRVKFYIAIQGDFFHDPINFSKFPYCTMDK